MKTQLYYFTRSYIADYLKIKHSFAIWLCIISAILITLLNFLIFHFKGQHFIKASATTQWAVFINQCFLTASSLLLPFFVVLFTAIVVNIEHKSNAWKLMYTMPIPRVHQYLSKYFLIITMELVTLIIFIVSIILAGFILTYSRRDLNFANSTIDWFDLFRTCYKIYISIFALTTIQYVVSNLRKNIAVSLGTGVAGIIAGLVLMRWKYIYLIPFVYPYLSFNKLSEGVPGALCLQQHEAIGLAYTVVLIIAGTIYTHMRNVS